MFFYHALLLLHFIDGNEINLPYFLLCSLINMASNVQRESKSLDNVLYHHGLIKILIESKEENQQDFLVRNQYVEDHEDETSKRVKRSRRRSLPNPNSKEENEKDVDF